VECSAAASNSNLPATSLGVEEHHQSYRPQGDRRGLRGTRAQRRAQHLLALQSGLSRFRSFFQQVPSLSEVCMSRAFAGEVERLRLIWRAPASPSCWERADQQGRTPCGCSYLP